MSRLLASTAFAAAIALSVPAWAATQSFNATLTGASEVPPTSSAGTGDAVMTFNTKTRKLDYTVTFSGLTGPAAGAHIHGPAAAGANAGVLVPFSTSATGPIKGSVKLTAAQAKSLEAGKLYVNVHTAANPGGEIRGQLTKGK